MNGKLHHRTRTYVGPTGGFDGYAGLVISKRYTGVPQEDGRVLVSAVGAPVSTGVLMSSAEWER